MIVGCCGSGKSTLARQLQKITRLELIHLDQNYFAPNWVEPDKESWARKVESFAAKDNWIIDGNYGGTMDIRLSRADTVILLKRSTPLCMYRAIKRIIKNYGKVRPDSAPGCKERFDLEFLHYVLVFNLTRLPGILKRLEKLKPGQQKFVLNNQKEVDDFLEGLQLTPK